MNPKFESAHAAGVSENKDAPKLFERLFPEPFDQPKDAVQTESKTTKFSPTAADIEEFSRTYWAGSGVTRQDLVKTSQQASAEGNTRNQQVADFLRIHFDDVSKLSENGNAKITFGDLLLYGQMLRANESSPDRHSPNVEEWKKLHYDQEIENILYPLTGSIAGTYGSLKLQDAVKHTPSVAKQFVAMAIRNPRTALFSLVAGSLATTLASSHAGAKIGDSVNRAINSGRVTQHFYDEAAPAMKRLMER